MASSRVMPIAIWVVTDEVAIAATQPKVSILASAITHLPLFCSSRIAFPFMIPTQVLIFLTTSQRIPRYALGRMVDHANQSYCNYCRIL
ncbi:MAG: hypothetical protein ACXADC_17175 [Candidatus Thorarchaeota archaeon]